MSKSKYMKHKFNVLADVNTLVYFNFYFYKDGVKILDDVKEKYIKPVYAYIFDYVDVQIFYSILKNKTEGTEKTELYVKLSEEGEEEKISVEAFWNIKNEGLIFDYSDRVVYSHEEKHNVSATIEVATDEKELKEYDLVADKENAFSNMVNIIEDMVGKGDVSGEIIEDFDGVTYRIDWHLV